MTNKVMEEMRGNAYRNSWKRHREKKVGEPVFRVVACDNALWRAFLNYHLKRWLMT